MNNNCFCPRCGNSVNSYDYFCTRCGLNLVQLRANSKSPNYNANWSNNHRKTSFFKTPWFALILCIVIFVLAVNFAVFVGNKIGKRVSDELIEDNRPRIEKNESDIDPWEEQQDFRMD